MAKYRMKPMNEWIGRFVRATKIITTGVVKVKCHCKDGSHVEHPAVGGQVVVDTNDERACRHLDADPRFVKIG